MDREKPARFIPLAEAFPKLPVSNVFLDFSLRTHAWVACILLYTNGIMSRFFVENETVIDTQTGLMWTKNASLLDFPMSWDEALNTIKECNHSELYGYHDWKLPNRKELFSLMSHETINPSIPHGHQFTNIFTGYYWTSSSCARLPNQAWYIHLGGARMFKGMKYGS